jgi:hypothetical protein
MRASIRMDTIVASVTGRVCREHSQSRKGCDFRDNNRVGIDSYFDEADMNG